MCYNVKQQKTINALKETWITRHRQEYSVTDWERCLEELIAGTLPEQICWTIDMVYCIDRFIVCELSFYISKVGRYDSSTLRIRVEKQEQSFFSKRVVPRNIFRIFAPEHFIILICSGAFFPSRLKNQRSTKIWNS